VSVAVFVINFGEPEEPTPEQVVPFLEKIFLQNGGLERHGSPEAARARARKLAEDRAPGLIEEYREIGGSPLKRQADEQAEGLQEELRRRGHSVTTYSCFQYTEPSLEAAVAAARADGMERLVGLPVYPLCGHSTNVMALRSLARLVEEEEGWEPELLEIGGWHGHPDFVAMHADHTRGFLDRRGVDPTAPGTAFLFSIHGTPVKYLEAGSRYDRYVEEACEGIARALGLEVYHMGYQNHDNRPIAWTQPDVHAVVSSLEAERLVVHPVAFMHEQSETLAELDGELREVAEGRGLEFHRVPVPFDDPRFIALLADMVEARLGAQPAGASVELRRCVCREGGRARCTNGLRLGDGTVRLGSESASA
jgi:ferrochelatase